MPKPGKASPMKAVRTPAAEELWYATGESTLGAVLVASSRHGVVAILISEEPDRLIDDLQERFPHAHCVRGDRDDERLAQQVIEYIEAPERGLDLDLDLRGTAFQKKVWQHLRKLPLGRTTTYTEVARKIGAPKAMRAVGNACSTNNLGLAIPCHRVLRGDGSLSGGDYWGMKRQGELIGREAAAAAKRRA
jgi:AraC family transcriptional regulator of adaptative response/methylated-DNA-[protein]-cysteine methyltransferase